jgi:bacterioferritin-associated ferredoxin
MLICHCNMITEKEIEQTIRSLLVADPWGLIVPAKVYHALQQRGRCCGCFPNVVEIIIRVTEEFHQELGEQKAESVTFLDRVRGLRSHREENNEGRQKGHRAA